MTDQHNQSRLTWTKLFFSFRGRISRRTFLWQGNSVIGIVLAILIIVGGNLVSRFRGDPVIDEQLSSDTINILIGLGICSTPLLWAVLALNVKRLHDRNRSGWWLILVWLVSTLVSWIGPRFPEVPEPSVPNKVDLGIILFAIALLALSVANPYLFIEAYLIRGNSDPNNYGDGPMNFSATIGADGNTVKARAFSVPRFIDFLWYPALIIFVILVRSLVVEPFYIPSGAMKPTLLIGDYVVVSKYSYGYSKYSFPIYNPPFPGRVFGSLPQRGDVAVFRLPRDPTIDYIKRIVGLPGDRIQMVDGVLTINGNPVQLKRVDDEADTDFGTVQKFIETLPNGVDYAIFKRPGHYQYDDTAVFTIPLGNVFVLGDNRDNSSDSRIPPQLGGVGFVPVEYLIGRADTRYFSSAAKQGQDLESIRWSRCLTEVH